MNMKVMRFLLLILLGGMMWCGCSSRYRLEMFMNAGGEDKKVKVEQTEFMENTVLNQPFAELKTVRGSGNCLVITISTRGEKLPVDRYRTLMFEYDEYVKKRIYIQLPPEIKPETIDLPGNSFIHLLGRYEQSPETKIFIPQSGTLVVDSLAKNVLYGTVTGHFENSGKMPLAVNGRFKVKYKP